MIFRKKPIMPPFRMARIFKKAHKFAVPVYTGLNSSIFSQYSGPDSIAFFAGTSKQEFYRYIRKSIPLVSCAIWAWTKLCNTPSSLQIEGKDIDKATFELNSLEKRILENPFFRGDNFRTLNELMFTELFTSGRFAVRIHLLPNGEGIDFLETLDAFDIHWKKDQKWNCFYGKVEKDWIKLNPEEVYIATLGMDIFSPFAVEPLSSIPFVLQIEQQFLDDMAKSSHNAGFPRLQIKINPPTPWEHEKQVEYQTRINNYFDQTVDAFEELDIDKNIFSWSDVDVTIIGGEKSRAFTWKINREQIIEDVITGMKLFPWVLGRSHGTTKEWVRSQYNLLLQEVDSVQSSARTFIEYITQVHLNLSNISASTRLVFEPNKDPFEMERALSFSKSIENLEKLFNLKVISEEELKKTLRNRFFQN